MGSPPQTITQVTLFIGNSVREGQRKISNFLSSESLSIIPLLEDTLKEWGFLQVMTQVIGQELYQAALHPLPTGSRIMGGQGKE
jgi:hypothetical protein